MNILVLTQKIDRNDSILGFFHTWLEHLAGSYGTVHVIALSVGEYALPENVHVYSLGKESRISRIQYLWRFYRYIWSLRRDYDAVFVHMNHEYVVLGGWLWRLMGKRIVLWYVHRHVRFTLRLAVLLAHQVLSTAAETFRIITPKLRIVGHGIDSQRFHCAVRRTGPPGVLHIATVGRITAIKRLDVLFEAVAIVQSVWHTDVQLTVIGEPITDEDRALEKQLRQHAQDAGIVGRVHWNGPLPPQALPDVLCQYDATVNLTPKGGIDKAVLESMSCAVPAFASNEVVARFFGEYRKRLQFRYGDARDLAGMLHTFSQLSHQERATIGDALRAQVIAHHGLPVLIQTLVRSLNGSL